MSHDNPESYGVCAHDGCTCIVNKDNTVRHDGLLYCSQGCAEGSGCSCQGCYCNDSGDAQPSINPPE